MNIFFTFLIGFLSALAGFFLHAWPRFKNRYFGVDTWRHLLVADYIRKNKKYPKLMPRHYLINEPSDYPPLLRFVLALFSRKFIDKNQFLFCPAIEFIHSLFIFVFVYAFSNSLALSLLTQIIYYTTPIVVMKNSSLTSRTLSALLFTFAFLLMLFFSIYPTPIALIGVLVLISLLLLTHRMSIQALTFLVIIFSLWERNLAYLGMFLGGILLACVVSGGFYIKILRGHLGMLRFWKAHIQYRYAHMVRGLKKDREEKDPVFKIYSIVQNTPFLAVLGANVFVVLPIAAIFLRRLSPGDYSLFLFSENFYQRMLLWSISLFVISLIIRQIKKLGFIGEGERYLEYSAFPVALISAILFLNIFKSFGLLALIITFGIFIFGNLLPALFLQYKVVVKDENRSVKEPLWKMFEYINSMQGEVKIITVPLYLSDATVYFSKAKAFTTDNSIAHITHYSGFWPILKRPLTDIMRENDIEFLLINEEFVKLQELGVSEESVLRRESIFCLCKINR